MLVVCLICINMFAQKNIEQAKMIIEKEMVSFRSVLDYMNSMDEEERYDTNDINFSFGGDYFEYNGKNYENLGIWLNNFYLKELKNHMLTHFIVVDNTSVVKLSDNPVDLRYRFNATLNRKNESSTDDFKLKEEKVSFVVMVEKERGIRILGIDGQWEINPIRPQYVWDYSLATSKDIVYIGENGGDDIISITSTAQQKKKYGDLEISNIGNPVPVEFIVKPEGNLTYKKNNDTISLKLNRNYSKDRKEYAITVEQQPVNINTGYFVNKNKGPYYKTINISQSGITRPISIWEKIIYFDEYDAPNMDVKFHYGLNNTFGLSTTLRVSEDYRFTLGLYAAMCGNRISQIEWGDMFKSTIITNSSSISSEVSIGTNIIVENGVEVTVEKYKETTHLTEPDKRGYSSIVDPDGEAEHKKVYSYIMVTPGMYVNNWVHLDLGIGFSRSQDTYWMADAYVLETKEISYEKNNIPVMKTEYAANIRSGESFLYKDRANWNFAVRPGVNFLIPLDMYEESYLTIGAGYTFVPGDVDANNLDFSIGYAFQF